MVAKFPAGLTLLDVATECFGATRLDGAHRAILHRGQTLRCQICRAVTREHLREFHFAPCRIRTVRIRPHSGALPRGGLGAFEQIQR